MPEDGVKDSVILGFLSFMTKTTAAAMTAMKTTQPTIMPASAPVDKDLVDPLFRLVVPAKVAVVKLPLAPPL